MRTRRKVCLGDGQAYASCAHAPRHVGAELRARSVAPCGRRHPQSLPVPSCCAGDHILTF
eukprot:scaffold271_cov112-Isochrysis_galbana.AAC.1